MIQTQYAPFSKRFAAFLIDKAILVMITSFFLIPPVSFFPRLFFDHSIFSFFSFGFGSVFLIANWVYFSLFESSSRQATPGKMLMGVFVTDEFGQRISFVRSLLRTVTKIISAMFCWLGYLLALFTGRSQALHDLLVSTLVLQPDYSPGSPYYASGPQDARTTEMPSSGPQQGKPAGGTDKANGTIQL